MRYFTLQDKRFMSRALELAGMGLGSTSPNPPVGAVVVSGGDIVGEGYHESFGAPHAEVNALRASGDRAAGGTLYVSLEPCSTHGKTPPCVVAIVEAGIRKVVVGRLDPNPVNRGRGVEYLRSKGVDVAVGVLEKEAARITEAFEKYITKGLPFFTVKAAMSLDGKIATAKGVSKWISGEDSRQLVHRMRSEADAVMVGINTVKADDPSLTVRLDGVEKKGLLKVVLDSRAEIPAGSKLLSPELSASTLIAVGAGATGENVRRVEEAGARVLRCGGENGRVDIGRLASELAKMGVVHVLVEGGGEVIAGCFREKLVDRVVFFIAGKIIGGRAAPTSVGGAGIDNLDDAPEIADMKCSAVGEDLVIEGYVKYPENKIQEARYKIQDTRYKIQIITNHQ